MKKFLLLFVFFLIPLVFDISDSVPSNSERSLDRLAIMLYNISANVNIADSTQNKTNEEIIAAKLSTLDKYVIRHYFAHAESSVSMSAQSQCLSDVKQYIDKRITVRFDLLLSEIQKVYVTYGEKQEFPPNLGFTEKYDTEILSSLLCDIPFDKYSVSEDGKIWVYCDNSVVCFSTKDIPDFILISPDCSSYYTPFELISTSCHRRIKQADIFERVNMITCCTTEGEDTVDLIFACEAENDDSIVFTLDKNSLSVVRIFLNGF